MGCPNCNNEIQTEQPFCPRCKFDLRHGSPNKPNAGQCIYCSFKGKLSSEHIFGHAFAVAFPKKGALRRQRLTRPSMEGDHEVLHSHAEKFRPGSNYDLKINNVCRPCNNNWMGALQKEAQPLVLRLAKGARLTLDKSQRWIMARWAVMVAFNLESYGRIQFSKTSQRKALMNGLIPDGCQITFGMLSSGLWGGVSMTRSFMRVLPGTAYPSKFHSIYFCVEQVAFHILIAPNDLVRRRLVRTVREFPGLQHGLYPYMDGYASKTLRYSLLDLKNIQALFAPLHEDIWKSNT